MLIKDVDLHHYNAFCQCTNCSETFILEYERRNTGFNFKQLHHNPMLKKKEFGELIGEVSPSFSDIYNQSYGAMQLELNDICGMGFRKALEFLVKDYAIRNHPDAEESIKKIELGTCINNYIADERIKSMAQRATWLGNDETHYVRRFNDRDISDLLVLIDLTVFWIQAEERTKKYEQEIQSRR